MDIPKFRCEKIDTTMLRDRMTRKDAERLASVVESQWMLCGWRINARPVYYGREVWGVESDLVNGLPGPNCEPVKKSELVW